MLYFKILLMALHHFARIVGVLEIWCGFHCILAHKHRAKLLGRFSLLVQSTTKWASVPQGDTVIVGICLV